jgi:probable rRNA maturation factor
MITIEPPSSPALSAALSISKPGLTRFLTRARAAVGLSGQVDVLLTSDVELKRLNRAYRGKNKATDVLSFPTPAEIAQVHAGDLAISIDTAASQATVFGHSLDIEVRVLLLHGLLHLSGLDHETDTGEMASREAELRTRLKLPISLIDRVTNRKPVKVSAKKPPTRRVRA